MLIVLSVVFRYPVPLMIGVFIGIVGILEHRVGPNIIAAIRAYDKEQATEGVINISVSELETDKFYRVLVREEG